MKFENVLIFCIPLLFALGCRTTVQFQKIPETESYQIQTNGGNVSAKVTDGDIVYEVNNKKESPFKGIIQLMTLRAVNDTTD